MEDKDIVSIFTKNLDKYGGSPAMIMRDSLLALQELSKGEYVIASAENPVALVLEAAAAQTAGFINKNFALNRRQYAISAQSMDDLYYHLNDLDWVGVFSLPAKAKLSISIEYDELINIMAPLDDGSGTMLRIPKGAVFVIGDIYFLLEYPIDIVRFNHGGIKITYNTTETSPLHSLTTNIVDYHVATIDGIRRLAFTVEVIQSNVTSFSDSITSDVTFDITKEFNNEFIMARVYTGNDATGWKEIQTTHCPDIYDVNKETAVLKVINNTLNIKIPKIYNTTIVDPNSNIITSRLGSRIKVDIYTTLGEITVDLGKYPYSAFSYNLYPEGINTRNYNNLGKYSEGLTSLKSVYVYSNDFVQGGRNKLSFEELRNRIINHTVGNNEIPISNVAIETRIQDSHFNVVKAVDYVTSREYWATRQLPDPSNKELITPASISIEVLNITISELLSTGTVKNNDKRLTITPESLFKQDNGITTMLNKSDIDYINSLSPEAKAKTVNELSLLYTPFHYVVDINDDEIELRPYYLDNPICTSKQYIDSNNFIDISLTIGEYGITKTDTGFKLVIITHSNQAYKDIIDDKVFAQLLVHPYNDKGYAYLQGELVGVNDKNERIFEFNINSNLDIDNNDCLILNNLHLANSKDTNIPIPLDVNFEIILGTHDDISNWQHILLDDRINTNITKEENVKAITCESISCTIGNSLKNLWVRARSNVSNYGYKKYTDDIPLTYTEDVYAEDTGSIIQIDGDTITYNKLHNKGDVVLDSNGNVVYKHRAGDYIKDDNGNLIVEEPRKIIRRLELMMIDGTYLFANDTIGIEYRTELVNTLLDWLIDGLEPINKKVLEQTRIKFYPSSSNGSVKVIYNDGIATYIDAHQSFKVDLVVTKQVANNEDILEKIKESTIKIIQEELNKLTVSSSSIAARLVTDYDINVIGMRLKGLGDNDKIVAFTVLEENKRCVIKKKLVVQADNTLGVTEDIIFNVLEHDS